jgi:hypothetical protein
LEHKDLSAFSEEGFNMKKWINEALAQKPANEDVVVTEMSCHFALTPTLLSTFTPFSVFFFFLVFPIVQLVSHVD